MMAQPAPDKGKQKEQVTEVDGSKEVNEELGKLLANV